MSQIVFEAEFPIKPGRRDQAVSAARALQKHVLENDEGMVVYQFYLKATDDVLAVIEVYRDETAMLEHIRKLDAAALFDCLDLTDAVVRLFGDLSEKGREATAAASPQPFSPI